MNTGGTVRPRNSGHQPRDSGSRTPSPELRAPNSEPRTEGGFTLLEVMVALAVLAVGIVSVLELFGGSLRLDVKASRRTQAVIYAQNVMDRLLAQNSLRDGQEAGELPGGYSWRAQIQEIHPDAERTQLQPNRQSPTDFFHLKEIEVGVYWRENMGQQSFVLRSLLTLTDQPQPQ